MVTPGVVVVRTPNKPMGAAPPKFLSSVSTEPDSPGSRIPAPIPRLPVMPPQYCPGSCFLSRTSSRRPAG
jgi:hypothetical protein